MHARMDDDSNKRHTAGRQGRTKHVKDLNCPLGSHPMCQSNLPIRIREAITKSIHVHKHISCLHRQIDDAEYSLHGVLSHSSMKQNTMPATLLDSRMLLQQQTTEKYLNQKAMAATNSPKSQKKLAIWRKPTTKNTSNLFQITINLYPQRQNAELCTSWKQNRAIPRAKTK